MTSMHQSHHVQTYSSTGHNLDHNLDALLDDLQTSVSRPGTSMALAPMEMNGGGSFSNRQVTLPPGASGYREITTTVTHETNGVPVTSRDYQIEYLNPANSVTVARERSSSPGFDYMKNAEGRNVTYKTESYGYKYETKTTNRNQPGVGVAGDEYRSIENRTYPREDSLGQNKSYQYSKTENYRTENANVNKNLNDLENLLKELNDTPGPQMTSTPSAVRREEHMTTRTLDSRSPARYDDSSNTMPKRSSSATRDVTYSEVMNRSDRSQSPYIGSGGTPKVQQRTVHTMEQRGHTSRRDTPVGRDRSSEMSPTLRRRTPSPSREFRPATFSSYPISPKDTQRTVTSKSTTSSSSYNYSTARRTPTPSSQSFDEPQPYRSPSPVSFPQKRSPSPVRKNITRTESGRATSAAAAPYQVSPQLSDPNSPTVITYKYTSHSSQHSKYPGGTYDEPDPSTPRPFPSVTPLPVEEQNPPKKLDELMASFQEPRQVASYTTEYSSTRETDRQNVDLQRSPSCERNVRPSEVRLSQTYSQSQVMQQQQQQPHHSHHHHHHHHHKHHDHHDRHHQQPQQPPYQQQQYQQQQYQQQSYQQQSYQQQQDNYAHQQYQQYQQYQQQQKQQQIPPQTPVNEVMTATGVQTLRSGTGAAAGAAAGANATKSVAGPPVYYPPGVELFAKKEEAMEQQMYGGKGKMKSKSKMKAKYESKEKSKEKSSSGVSAVPLCLPVCCAAPCVIM